MKRLPERIMVVIEDVHAPGETLARGVALARFTGSSLHLLYCGAKAKDLRAADMERLHWLCDQYIKQGCRSTLSVRQTSDIYAAVEDELSESPSGLVIKQRDASEGLRGIRLGHSSDWRLLRYCPVPVLLLQPGSRWQPLKVLAAIDADPVGASELALNKLIMLGANALARASDGEVHLVTAYPSPLLGATEPHLRSSRTAREHYCQRVRGFLEKYCIPVDRLHVEEGPADLLIQQKAEELGVTLVVVGSVVRGGLRGALLGNTAEQVLEQTSVDVMAVRFNPDRLPAPLAEHQCEV